MRCHGDPLCLLRIGDFRWNRQLDFGARTVLAPNIDLGADLLRPLAHARQTPVARASFAQRGCIAANPTDALEGISESLTPGETEPIQPAC